MLHLASHYGSGYSGSSEGLDEPRKFAQRKPMDGDARVGCFPFIDLRLGFFLDGCDDDFAAFGTSGIQKQKREAAVAGDQAELHSRHGFRSHDYLITPRS